MGGSRPTACARPAARRADALVRPPGSGLLAACALLFVLAACGGDSTPPAYEGPAESPSEALDATPELDAAPPEPVHRGALRLDGGETTGELAGGGVDLYDLDLEAGWFVRIVVDQQGVDVVPALEGPDGELLTDADRMVADDGPELILAVSERAGRHVLRIATPGDGGPGRYTVRLEQRRPASDHDRALAAAYARFNAARRSTDEEQKLEGWSETVETARRLDEPELEGDALWRLGYLERRDRRRAVALYGEAADAFARAGAGWGEAIVRVDLGISLLNLGELEEAKEELTGGLALARAAGDRHDEARALSSLGEIETKWGELQAALDHYEPALALWPEGRSYFRASTLHGLGVLLARYLGDVERGRELLREAAASWPDNWSSSRSVTLSQLGQLAFERGEPGEARRLLEESLGLSGDAASCTGAAIRARLALVEQAAGAGEAADRRITEALGAVAGGPCPVSEPTVGLLAAGLAERRGDRPAALERYRRSLELYRARGDRWGRVECLSGIAHIERSRAESGAALDAADRALALIEGVRPTILREDLRTSYFAGAQDLFELRIDLLAAAGRSEDAWVTAERARAQALRDLLVEAGAGLREGAAPELAGRERELRRRLNALESRRLRAEAHPELLATIEREIDGVVAELESVRGEIRRGLDGASGTEPGPLTASALRAGLEPGTLLLELRLGDERSHLWAVTRDAVEGFELPPRAEIESLVKNAARWLESPEWPRGRTPGPVCALSRAVLGPVAGLLGERPLLLVPDGALETVAFAALPEPGGDDCAGAPPLIAGHQIVHLPSAAVLGTLERRLAGRTPAPGWLAVVADPVYGADDERLAGRAGSTATPAVGDPAARGATEEAVAKSFSRLRFAGAEADALLSLVPAAEALPATGFDAGRRTVLGGALSRYRIVHFATHGVLDPDHPLLSFLALTQLDRSGAPIDGPLYAHEIYGLDLPAELVVLSACDTALGREVRGEGLVSGLPRAFLYAGAARVLVSLWQVRDDSTRELMSGFYRGLLERGLSPAGALREAQLAMSRRGDPPYRWAGFVLQGDPRPLPAFTR